MGVALRTSPGLQGPIATLQKPKEHVMTLIFFAGVAVLGGLYAALACNALKEPTLSNIGILLAYIALVILSTYYGSPMELKEAICP